MNREERRRAEKVQSQRSGTVSSAASILREAQLHHQAGRIDEAEQGYRLILERAPAQPDALHGLGLLLYRDLRDGARPGARRQHDHIGQ